MAASLGASAITPKCGRIGLRDPPEIIDRLRPAPLSASIDLVDRDHLARLRLGQQILVVETPPGGRIAAEGLAPIGGVAALARRHVENSHLDDIARRGPEQRHRPGADVNTEPLAGTAAVDRGIDRPGATSVDILAVPGPVKDAFRAGIPQD